MKNLFGALAAGMLVCTSVMAAPVGNPSAPLNFEDGIFLAGNSDYSLRLGYSGNFVMDRKLEIKANRSHVDSARIVESTANVTLSMFNRMDVYGRFGSARFGYEQNNTSSNLEVRTADAFIWALGGRVVVYNWDFTTLTLFGEYSRFKADVNDVLLGATSSGYSAAEARVRQWDLGLALAHQIDYMSPYVAIKYSDASVRFHNEVISSPSVTLNKLEARGNFGAAVGCTFLAGKKLDLTLEGRFIDENAVSLTGQFRF